MKRAFSYLRIISILVILFCAPRVHGKPFVIGELYGQLGNQCFQVAATLSHAWDHDAIPLFPDFKTRKENNIPLNFEKVFWRLDTMKPKEKNRFRYVTTDIHYNALPYEPNMTLAGYFQSEKYFKKYKERIRSMLAPSKEIMDYLESKYSKIIEHPRSISIHFRDYGTFDPLDVHRYSFPGKEYYKKAFARFPKDSLFVIFSDNIAWCKEHLRDLANNIIFIEGEAHYHDFYLMSLCKHNVICNSTFSWWAAYLNQNPEKIIVAPQKWIDESTGLNSKDMIPEGWITIP